MRSRLQLYVPERRESSRVKKVAREIRRILSEIFAEQDIPPVWDAGGAVVPFPGPLTVTDVKLAADLVDCKVFVMPLANRQAEAVEPYFSLAAPLVRKQFAARSVLRLVPNFHFLLDSSFQTAERLDALLAQKPGKDHEEEE